MKLLAQYYNEVFKQEKDSVFEELGEEDVRRLEKILARSVAFDWWKTNRALKELDLDIKEAFQKIGIIKIEKI